MPRGNPKQPVMVRLDPALIAEVRKFTPNLTLAIEVGLRWWVRRARRNAAQREPVVAPQQRRKAAE